MFLWQDTVGFDPDIVWNSVVKLGISFLRQLPYIVIGIIVFFLFLLFARVVRRSITALAHRSAHIDRMLADLLGRVGSALFTIFGVLVAAVIIFPTFQPGDLITGLGITSVAVGFAFKDVLQNFFAGILILWRRPFLVGDIIKVENYEGTVEEINVRSTRLKTYDGERAILPNGDVYTSAVLVRTAYEKRRLCFEVGIGYLDDIEQGRETIRRVLEGIDLIEREPGPYVFVSELAPSSVNFNVFFWISAHNVNPLEVKDKVATGIKYALDRKGIDMPYPHTVVLFHDATGTRRDDIRQEDYLGGKRATTTGGESASPRTD